MPGSGSWDYLRVDEAARRLYVSPGTQVEVLDIDSLTLVGAIPKTAGVHEVALAPEVGRGFVSNGQTSTVTIFDLKTLTDCRCADWAKPDAIIYDDWAAGQDHGAGSENPPAFPPRLRMASSKCW